MTDNIIKLNKDSVFRLGIQTDDGKDTGEYLEFQLDDIELPLRYQELLEEDKKNKQWIRNQEIIINKREDVKGKKLMSKNEEDLIRAVNEFFKKEVEIYNKFLGENGVQKLLNGRPMGWTRLQEIDEIISKYIVPKLEMSRDNIKDKIKSKYGISKDKEVLKEDE